MRTVYSMQLDLIKDIYMKKFRMACKLSFVGDLQINEWQGRKNHNL